MSVQIIDVMAGVGALVAAGLVAAPAFSLINNMSSSLGGMTTLLLSMIVPFVVFGITMSFYTSAVR